MNVPLNWLSEYVELPKNLGDLTDKLTLIGHMLDKVKKVGNETVIDLELRGNRADMFGLIGVAREVAAAFNKKLKLPPVVDLPKTDPKSPLIHAEISAAGLVIRYIAVKLSVRVGPSPKWLVDRLVSYGIQPINNVVDVTNYVMVETSHPMHAFDHDLLKGGKLILRQAKNAEKFNTIQQGTTLTLTGQDLAICDSHGVQGLTTIGGLETKVTADTKNIVLETAVYNAASSRRTARRHKIFTESGNRHEKHQDPQELPFTLARAVYLLQKVATAKITSDVSDYYPKAFPSKLIKFSFSEIERLTGCTVREPEIILKNLGFSVHDSTVTVPSFRTDVEGSADLVEEVVRLHGYDKIPARPLAGLIPSPDTYPTFALQEKIRDALISLGVSEAITYSMTSVSQKDSLSLLNPPDPSQKYLRRHLYPNLVSYANRLLNQKTARVVLFEVGQVFLSPPKEKLHLCIVSAGSSAPANWHTPPKPLDLYDLKGIVDSFQKLTGLTQNGNFGQDSGVFWYETELDSKSVIRLQNIYTTSSTYPPIIEDINLNLTGSYETLEKKIYKTSPLIKKVELIDKYDAKLTLRLTYHDPRRQLSSQDVAPVRSKLENF